MFKIRKAERKQAKLRLALTGVSGSGKTLGAIRIAKGMDKKFIVIDTEHKSADLYASEAEYDVLTLDKPFTPERYISAINMCEAEGYEIIIIDSLSHAWAGEGGLLEMHDKVTNASPSKNSYMAWGKITPEHNKLINAMLQSPAHIIATMRSKTHHEVVNDGGKSKPIKIGLAPVQREGMDYEFTVVLDIDKESHVYSASKDRTTLFDGKNEKISVETGKKLMAWLDSGKSLEEIEKEEIEQLKNKILQTETLDSLRQAYQESKKYPAFKDELHKLMNERKLLIENNGVAI